MSKRRGTRRSARNEVDDTDLLGNDALEFKPGPISSSEYKARMQACTKLQLAQLQSTPEFAAWSRSQSSPLTKIKEHIRHATTAANQQLQQLSQHTATAVGNVRTAIANTNQQQLVRACASILVMLAVCVTAFTVQKYPGLVPSMPKIQLPSSSSLFSSGGDGVVVVMKDTTGSRASDSDSGTVPSSVSAAASKQKQLDATVSAHQEEVSSLQQKLQAERERAELLATELATAQSATKAASGDTERLSKLLKQAEEEAAAQKLALQDALKKQTEAMAAAKDAKEKAKQQQQRSIGGGSNVVEGDLPSWWAPIWSPGMPLLLVEAIMLILALSAYKSVKTAQKSHLHAAAAHAAARERKAQLLSHIAVDDAARRAQQAKATVQAQTIIDEQREVELESLKAQRVADDAAREKERNEAAAWLTAAQSLLGSLSPTTASSPTKSSPSTGGGNNSNKKGWRKSPSKNNNNNNNNNNNAAVNNVLTPQTKQRLSTDPSAWKEFIDSKLASLKERAAAATLAASQAETAAANARRDSDMAHQKTSELITDKELLKEQLTGVKKQFGEAQALVAAAKAKEAELVTSLAETQKHLDTITSEKTKLHQEVTTLTQQLSEQTSKSEKLATAADQSSTAFELESKGRQRAEARVATLEQELVGLTTLAQTLETDKEELESQLKEALDARAQALATARRIAAAGHAVQTAAREQESEGGVGDLDGVVKEDWDMAIQELNAQEAKALGRAAATLAAAATGGSRKSTTLYSSIIPTPVIPERERALSGDENYDNHHHDQQQQPSSMPMYMSHRLNNISRLLGGDVDAINDNNNFTTSSTVNTARNGGGGGTMIVAPASHPIDLSEMPLSARLPMSARGLATARSTGGAGGGGPGGRPSKAALTSLAERTSVLLNRFASIENMLGAELPTSKDGSTLGGASSSGTASAPATVRGPVPAGSSLSLGLNLSGLNSGGGFHSARVGVSSGGGSNNSGGGYRVPPLALKSSLAAIADNTTATSSSYTDSTTTTPALTARTGTAAGVGVNVNNTSKFAGRVPALNTAALGIALTTPKYTTNEHDDEDGEEDDTISAEDRMDLALEDSTNEIQQVLEALSHAVVSHSSGSENNKEMESALEALKQKQESVKAAAAHVRESAQRTIGMKARLQTLAAQQNAAAKELETAKLGLDTAVELKAQAEAAVAVATEEVEVCEGVLGRAQQAKQDADTEADATNAAKDSTAHAARITAHDECTRLTLEHSLKTAKLSEAIQALERAMLTFSEAANVFDNATATHEAAATAVYEAEEQLHAAATAKVTAADALQAQQAEVGTAMNTALEILGRLSQTATAIGGSGSGTNSSSGSAAESPHAVATAEVVV